MQARSGICSGGAAGNHKMTEKDCRKIIKKISPFLKEDIELFVSTGFENHPEQDSDKSFNFVCNSVLGTIACLLVKRKIFLVRRDEKAT